MQCMWNHGRPGQGAGQELKALGLGLAEMGVILLKSLVSKSGPIPSLHRYTYSGVAHCKIGAAGGVGGFSNSRLSKYSGWLLVGPCRPRSSVPWTTVQPLLEPYLSAGSPLHTG